jgi:anti-sigma factor RsiW
MDCASQGCGLDHLGPVVSATTYLREHPLDERARRRRDETVLRALRAHPVPTVAEAADLSPRAIAKVVLGATRERSAPPRLLRGLLRARGRIALAVGMGTGAGQGAAGDDQVLLADRAPDKVALEDLPGPGRIARLGGET